MSCLNGTSPIDISMKNVSGNCDLKCNYSFKYNNSSCTVTNRTDYLSIHYDKASVPPVKYNSYGYDVNEVRIYTPSLHSFNGTKADGEIIISHNSSSGSKPLLVCVPFKKNGYINTASNIISKIIDTVSSNAPSDGVSTSVYIDNFNLNEFVPKKPFFSYSATIPYQPCIQNVDFVVYTPADSICDISNEAYVKLVKIVKKNVYDIKKDVPFFYNKKGPINVSSDEIYIDCQPVGQSEEQTVIEKNINQTAEINWDSIKKNPAFQIFIGCLFALIIIIIFSYFVSSVKSTNIDTPKFIKNIGLKI